MATRSLSTLRSRLRTYLSDASSKTWKVDGDLDLFLNHAIVKFTMDVPTRTQKTYTIATDQVGNANTYAMPDDFVRGYYIRGYFESSTVLENVLEINLHPGSWDDYAEPRGYIVDWPAEGSLYLPRQPDGSTFTLYYGAYHDAWLSSDSETVDLGRRLWGELAILAYAAFLAFNPTSAQRANLEQWARKGDQNVGNPLEEEAQRWLAFYQSLLDDHDAGPAAWDLVEVGAG